MYHVVTKRRAKMRQNTHHVDADWPELEHRSLEQYTNYEDDGTLVICDRENPKAWIRSTETASIDV